MDDLITLGVEVKTNGSAQAAQGLGSFEKAAQSAAGAADKLEDKVNALGAAQSKSIAPAKAMAGAVNGIGSAFKNNASSIQNASFQLSDVIVQVTGGVDATRALGMQLPQLLGGFGPLGAVLGVVAGVLLSVVPMFFDAADGAKELKDTVKELEDAVKAYSAASQAAAAPTEQLAEQYGKAGDKARILLRINKELAQLTALDALSEAMSGLVAKFGDFGSMSGANIREVGNRVIEMQKQIDTIDATPQEKFTDELSRTQFQLEGQIALLSRYTQGIDQVQGILGSTREQAIEFSAALAEMQDALTVQDKIAALDKIRFLFLEITGGTQNMTKEQRDFLEQIVNSQLASLDLADGVDAAAASISTATNNASSLADQLSRAVDNAITLSAQSLTARTEAEIRLRFKGDTVGEAGALAAARFPKPANLPDGAAAFVNQKRDEYIANMTAAAEAQKALADFNKEVKGGASGAKTAASDIKRYYDATRTDGEKYADGLKQINELHASGAMDADLYARSVQQLAEQFDPLGQLISGLADTVENELNAAFASVLDGTKSLGEALLDFAGNVLAKVAQDLFAQQFAAPIAAGIKGLFSENGNVFGPGGYVPFAKGGVVSGPAIFPFANGTGLMGEAGPEAIMPLSRGADGRLGVVAANGNSAPKITINNYSGQEASASTDNMGNIIVEIGRAVAQDITGGGPTYRAIKSTFGISNRLQQRG
jgi:hypothetical protein